MLNLRCPKCKNTMLYQPQNSEKNIAKKTKRCVYCGHNFNVKNNIIDK